MAQATNVVQAIEINAGMIGALFTEKVEDRLRIFCFYFNGDIGQFDVPEESNRDSLHSLFAKLDMVDQCTNVILDKVVRGRIYVEREGNLYNYTLLAAIGDVHPELDTDICNLPWKTVWSSQEAEVMRVPGVGQAEYCYAIRSPVTEVDVAAFYRNSKAFVNPKPVSHKNTGIHGYTARQITTAVMLVLAVGLGWLAGYIMGNNTHGTPTQPTPIHEERVVTPTVEIKVQMLAAKAITGPYTITELARMHNEGKVPVEAMFRVMGNTEWVHWQELPQTTAPATRGERRP